MSKKVAFSRIDSNGNFLQFDEDGNRIVDLSEPAPYKPQYDMEIDGYSAPYEVTVYFDIHTPIAKFKAKSVPMGQLRGIAKILLHKYVLRHFQ